ncbi:MAG TPA: alkyl sulfatase C-terminal domain-containing protein, partial [Caulobacteraceae bacterium]
VRLNGPKAGATALKLGVAFTDTNERFLIEVGNGVMRHYADRADPAWPTITLARPTLVELISGAKTPEAAQADGSLTIDGDAQPFADLLALLDRFDFWFEIIEP